MIRFNLRDYIILFVNEISDHLNNRNHCYCTNHI